MIKQNLIILTLILISNFSFSQVEKKISIDHYFTVIDSLQFNKLKENGVIGKNDKIANEYKEKDSETLNEKGFEILANVRADVYMNYFKNYLLLQSLEYENSVYALYFSVAGFDDIEFQILKCKKENWKENVTVDKSIIYEHRNQIFEKIAFNYDEGPKNIENPRIFINKNYLVMERSGLYYSLYDLKSKKLLVNDQSPWSSADVNNEVGLNKWIKKNLHDKIKAIIEK